MRLIDADLLKEDLTRFYDGIVTAKELIDSQPTVELPKDVRCKDCISRVPAKDPDCCVCRNPVSPCYQREVRDSDLCQFGEGGEYK